MMVHIPQHHTTKPPPAFTAQHSSVSTPPRQVIARRPPDHAAASDGPNGAAQRYRWVGNAPAEHAGVCAPLLITGAVRV